MAITSFDTRVDKRLVGSEVLITSEPHTVPSVAPYLAYLIEVPLLLLPTKDVTIPGFTKVAGLPGPNQFSVSFTTGIIVFNAAQAGSTVYVTYWGTGSSIIARDVNEMHAPINALETLVQPRLLSNGTIQLAIFTDTTETTLISGWGTSEEGRTWFNTTSKQSKLWNGSAVVITG